MHWKTLQNYLMYSAEKFNVIKVDYDGITPMEKFSGTTTDITH